MKVTRATIVNGQALAAAVMCAQARMLEQNVEPCQEQSSSPQHTSRAERRRAEKEALKRLGRAAKRQRKIMGRNRYEDIL